ncbi:MAG: HDIG domain-containing protein [Defluviitaleaceae bacterium]|nr:HDIG domain-containing protein [Defluviitaleaceae bacterium]MCL2263138.1 HDIG domain-containing protein [Defluviitaleaceae bacterium]
MTITQAETILKKYNTEPFLIQHGQTVSGVMGYYAKKYDPEREEYWRVVGMLHDTDFEQFPEEHCVKGIEILRNEGVPEDIIAAALSHGHGMTKTPYEPKHMMEKILFATDELTGLIGAAALMRPSKSTLDMELSSVKKKFKDKKFAAGCSRDVIKLGAEKLGWELDELINETILAMREVEQNAN